MRNGIRAWLIGLSLGVTLGAPQALAHSDGPVPGSECSNQGPFGLPGIDLPPDEVGQWGPVEDFPFQATHSTVLHTGKVMVWRRGIDSPTNQSDQPPFLWDPADHSLRQVDQPDHTDDLFCSGHSTLADGRVLVAGGTVNRLNKLGSRDVHAFDPATESWTRLANLKVGRWYPTVTTLGDGKVLAMSGDINPEERSRTPEIYDPSTNKWTLLNSARLNTETYPFNFVAPNGNYFYAGGRGSQSFSWELNLDTRRWTRGPRVNHRGGQGASGSAAMYVPGKVIKIGGRSSSSNEFDGAEVIDLNQPNPNWREIQPMNFFRRRADLVMLPDGKGLAVGGSKAGQASHECAVHAAEMWDPVTESWSQMASHARPRIYHSTAVLLPDGRVLAAGGENHDSAEENAEVYSPPYLFRGARPTIAYAPSVVGYGTAFNIETLDAEDIASVSLVRPAATTHNFDQNQRFIPLDFSVTEDGLSLAAPANGNIAPPGYYMLFVVNSDGVPSVASWVQLLDTGAGGNQIPTVRIDAPLNNAFFAVGEPITLMGSAADHEDGDLNASIEWSSDRDGVLGSGAVFTTSNLQVGPHFLTATVTDSGGATDSSSIVLTINFEGGGSLATLEVLGDSIARKRKATTAHGALSYLPILNDQEAYLIFDTTTLSGLIASANLELLVTNVNSAGTLNVHSVQGSWNESNLTWDNRPTIDMSPRASMSIDASDLDTVVELDITSLVAQWSMNPALDFGLALLPSDGLNIRASSREGEVAPSIEVVDIALPVVSLLTPSQGAEFFEGVEVSFGATALDIDETDISDDLLWTSDVDGQIGLGASFTTSTLSGGAHRITASVENSDSQTGQVQFSILIIEAMPIEFSGQLTADQVVGGVAEPSLGSGKVHLTLNADRTQLSYSITFDAPLSLSADVFNETDPNGITKVHIHNAHAGETGPHVLNVFGLPAEDDDDMVADLENGTITGTWDDSDAAGDPASPATTKLLSDFVPALIENDLYLGVHTQGAGGGVALRAQITRLGAATINLPVIDDTFSRKDKPDLSLGSLDYVRASENRIGFLGFDISQLSGSVASATLRLPVRKVYRSGVLVVNYALSPWAEGTLNYGNMPSLNVISEGSISLTADDDGTTASLDVTDRVREWISNPASAAGLGLTTTLGLRALLEAKEGGSGAYLEVIFN